MPILSVSSTLNTAFVANHHQRLRLLMMTIAVLTPLTSQAALPDSIQTALTKANLSSDNISIIITPIGDKTNSHLPPIITVIDSSKSVDTDNANTVEAAKATQAKNSNQPIKNKATTAIIVDKQAIDRQERQLQAYTDDPYTYQSLKNLPPILVIDETTTIRYSNTIDTSDSSQNSNLAKSQLSSLVSHNPETSRTPASTMKLIPSFVALDSLGADFVWFTRVYHTGLIIGDRLQGDLIIQGSGDPKMTHERLEQLLYQVQKTGIRHIDGDIVVDSSIFAKVTKDPGAFDNAPLRPYNASPDGFLVNFNSLGIYTYPIANGKAQLSYMPKLAEFELPSSIDTRSASCAQASSSLAPQWQENKLVFHASLPDSCGEHIFYINYPDPKDFAARIIAKQWQTLGNTLSGKVLSQEQPYNAYNNTKNLERYQRIATGLSSLTLSPLPLVSYPSYNLTQQIYDINHFSNNVMTEQVALSIGSYNNNTKNYKNNAVDGNATLPNNEAKTTSLYQFGKATITNYPQALEQINKWWQNTLTTTPPYLTNGSGLYRDCTVTAANLAELLSYAYDHPSFDAYVNSLGVAGVSGTIMYHSERLPKSAAIGRAWIKTGTLSNVAAMAGYVKGKSGQDYVVVGLINTEEALDPYVARPVLDTMLDWSAQQ